LLYVYGKPGVWAWDRPEPCDARSIDLRVYRKLMLRAAADVFQPFGVSLEELTLLVEGNFVQVPLPATRVSRKIETGREAESRLAAEQFISWPETIPV
jgi:hypothetical protein